MNVKDLRIGNYVKPSNGVMNYPSLEPMEIDYVEVENIGCNGIVGVSWSIGDEWLHASTCIEYLDGVPITDELLINLGFIEIEKDKFQDDCYNLIEKVELIDNVGNFHFLLLFDNGYRKVEYLHEFQNLIFALKNKEYELQK